MVKRYHTAKHAIHPPTDNLPLERLREAVRRMGGVTAVATMADIPVSSMSGYIYGREMKLSAAVKIARVCSVSLEWLAGITEHPASAPFVRHEDSLPTDLTSDSDADAIYHLPFYESGYCVPHEGVRSEITRKEEISISRNLLDTLGAKADTLIVAKMCGDSMEPTLRNGDLALVDTTPKEAAIGLHVIMINGRIMVRRIAYSLAGGATLIADNKLYPSQDIDCDEMKWGDLNSKHPAVVIGRVIYRFLAT